MELAVGTEISTIDLGKQAAISFELWCEAYARCYEEKGEDSKSLDALKEILGFSNQLAEGIGNDHDENKETDTDNRRREFKALSMKMQSELPRRLKKLEGHSWTIPLLKTELNFEEVVGKCVDAITLVKDFVGAALTTNPHASLGWSAVCLGIQFVKNPIKGQKDLLDAFHNIPEIMYRFAVVESLPQLSEKKSPLKEGTIKLYRLIMTFQAKALKYLNRHTIHRAWNDTIEPNYWATLLQGIKDQEKICNETLTKENSKTIMEILRDVDSIREKVQDAVNNQMIAFQRLQGQVSDALDEETFNNLLRHCAEGAVYSSDKPRCLLGTRFEILSQIMSWISREDCDGERAYWISGMAGMGKSTIAGTISNNCREQGYLVASFFFSRDTFNRDNASCLVPTIARQLMDSSGLLKRHICRALRIDHGHFDRPANEQWNSLIKEPLANIEAENQGSFAPPTVLLVIDALDECAEEFIQHITSILDSFGKITSIRFRALLTSRRTQPVQNEMRGLKYVTEIDLFRDVKQDEIRMDIRRYYNHRLLEIKTSYLENCGGWADEDELEELKNWPAADVVSLLVEKTDGLFQFAKVACNIIQRDQSGESPAKRIKDIGLYDIGFGGLDELYAKALMISVSGDDSKKADGMKRFFVRFQLIIGSILFLFEPLTGSGIASLLKKEDGDIKKSLIKNFAGRLESVLSVPNRPDEPIRSIHLSFRELLSDKKRCQAQGIVDFHIKEEHIHDLILRCCMKTLALLVPAKFCEDETMIRVFLEEEYGDRGVPIEARYASIYWISHCRKTAFKLDAFRLAVDFIANHAATWIGVLFFLNEPQEEIRLAIAFEDLVDDIKSIVNGLSREDLQSIDDTSRYLFENLN